MATETVQAVLMTAPGEPLAMRRLPAPRPRPGGAVLETVASEVCGTDVHLHHGRLSGVPYPIIPGHVSVGRVLEKNGFVFQRSGSLDTTARGALEVDFFKLSRERWKRNLQASRTVNTNEPLISNGMSDQIAN